MEARRALLAAALTALALPVLGVDRCPQDPVDDIDADGYAADVDCDDGEPEIHPDAAEACDGVDNDCDGQIDDDCPMTFETDYLSTWAIVSGEDNGSVHLGSFEHGSGQISSSAFDEQDIEESLEYVSATAILQAGMNVGHILDLHAIVSANGHDEDGNGAGSASSLVWVKEQFSLDATEYFPLDGMVTLSKGGDGGDVSAEILLQNVDGRTRYYQPIEGPGTFPIRFEGSLEAGTWYLIVEVDAAVVLEHGSGEAYPSASVILDLTSGW